MTWGLGIHVAALAIWLALAAWDKEQEPPEAALRWEELGNRD